MQSPVFARLEESSLTACCAQFPRSCSACRRPHPTFLSFIEATRPVGVPKLDHDDDEEDAIGLLSFANCACGSTLAVRYEDVTRHASFNEAVRQEAAETKRTTVEVATALVVAVNARARRDSPAAPTQVAVAESTLLEVGAAMVATLAKGAVLIPPFPAVAFKVAELARNPASTPEQIARAISSDPLLAAELLQLVNAPIYSRGRPVTSLPVAITRLGMKEVARLALAAGVGSASARPGALMAVRQHLWHRSVTTAMISHLLGAHRGVPPEEGFLAGLLHPLGSIVGTLSLEVFLNAHPTFPAQSLAAWLRLLELFRTELGALTATRWNLPTSLSESISAQSGAGASATSPELISTVLAAAQVARVAADVDEVTEAHLLDLTEVRADERALLVRELPRLAEAIASFEDVPVVKAAASHVLPAELAVEHPKPARDVFVVNVRRRAERHRVVSFSPRALLLEGVSGLAENLLTGLEVVTDPPLPFFATAGSSFTIAGKLRMVVAPFALSQETHRRLTLLMAHNADCQSRG